MGCSLETYRARIGLFNAIRQPNSKVINNAWLDFLLNLVLFCFILLNNVLTHLCKCVLHNLKRITDALSMIIFVGLLLLVLSRDIELNPGPLFGNLSLCHINVQSLFPYEKFDRFNEMKEMVDELSLDVLALTETWLPKRFVNDRDLLIDNFSKPYRHDRPFTTSDRGGGVMVYVSHHLVHNRLHRVEVKSPSFENVWLKITTKDKTILLGVYYRPPKKH